MLPPPAGALALLQECGQAGAVAAAGERWLQASRAAEGSAQAGDAALAVALARWDLAQGELGRWGDVFEVRALGMLGVLSVLGVEGEWHARACSWWKAGCGVIQLLSGCNMFHMRLTPTPCPPTHPQAEAHLEAGLRLLRHHSPHSALLRTLQHAQRELQPRLALALLALPAGEQQRERGMDLACAVLLRWAEEEAAGPGAVVEGGAEGSGERSAFLAQLQGCLTAAEQVRMDGGLGLACGFSMWVCLGQARALCLQGARALLNVKSAGWGLQPAAALGADPPCLLGSAPAPASRLPHSALLLPCCRHLFVSSTPHEQPWRVVGSLLPHYPVLPIHPPHLTTHTPTLPLHSQVELYQRCGTACASSPPELYTTALALIAEGSALLSVPHIRAAAALLEGVAGAAPAGGPGPAAVGSGCLIQAVKLGALHVAPRAMPAHKSRTLCCACCARAAEADVAPGEAQRGKREGLGSRCAVALSVCQLLLGDEVGAAAALGLGPAGDVVAGGPKCSRTVLQFVRVSVGGAAGLAEAWGAPCTAVPAAAQPYTELAPQFRSVCVSKHSTARRGAAQQPASCLCCCSTAQQPGECPLPCRAQANCPDRDDLLPGLCLLAERWTEEVALCAFRCAGSGACLLGCQLAHLLAG